MGIDGDPLIGPAHTARQAGFERRPLLTGKLLTVHGRAAADQDRGGDRVLSGRHGGRAARV